MESREKAAREINSGATKRLGQVARKPINETIND